MNEVNCLINACFDFEIQAARLQKKSEELCKIYVLCDSKTPKDNINYPAKRSIVLDFAAINHFY